MARYANDIVSSKGQDELNFILNDFLDKEGFKKREYRAKMSGKRAQAG